MTIKAPINEVQHGILTLVRLSLSHAQPHSLSAHVSSDQYNTPYNIPLQLLQLLEGCAHILFSCSLAHAIFLSFSSAAIFTFASAPVHLQKCFVLLINKLHNYVQQHVNHVQQHVNSVCIRQQLVYFIITLQ